MKALCSRPTDPRGRSSLPRWRNRLLAVGCGALLLAGCGGDPETDADDELTVAGDQDEPAADDGDAAGTPTDDVEASDASGDDDASDDDDADDGPTEHRPPSELDPDCEGVSEPSPGAIILFPGDEDPEWLEAGPGPVTVEVVGCSDTFEANLQYEAFHGQDTSPTLSGFTQGGTLGDWAPFSFEETYWTPGDWTVVVFDDDAESGDRVEYDEVTFTVD